MKAKHKSTRRHGSFTMMPTVKAAGARTGRFTSVFPNIEEVEHDPFHIPNFLRIPQSKRNEAWERNPPTAMPAFSLQRTASPETQAAIDAARRVKQEKENARLRGLKARKSREPTDTRGMVWDTSRSRFVPDRFAHIKCVPGKGVHDTSYTPPKDDDEPITSKPRAAADDLGAQVSAHCGTDNAKLKAFAKANGVWQDKYDDLPNNGLRRMNVVNRLRGRLKKEPKFKVKF